MREAVSFRNSADGPLRNQIRLDAHCAWSEIVTLRIVADEYRVLRRDVERVEVRPDRFGHAVFAKRFVCAVFECRKTLAELIRQPLRGYLDAVRNQLRSGALD